MPKTIDIQTQVEIIEFLQKPVIVRGKLQRGNQHEAARKFGLSRTYINALVNGKPTVKNRIRPMFSGCCPITGFKNY
jgi:hypothetical protein